VVPPASPETVDVDQNFSTSAALPSSFCVQAEIERLFQDDFHPICSICRRPGCCKPGLGVQTADVTASAASMRASSGRARAASLCKILAQPRLKVTNVRAR
jgi:hypothetical protein